MDFGDVRVERVLAGTKARAAEEILAEARQLVEPVHRSVVARLPYSMRHIAGYHAGWWNADGSRSAGGGKALRPALVLGCSHAVGGDGAAAVRSAVAVELVHDFSLLHDDIMDADRIRRSRPSAWSVFGVGPAILAGDMLLAVAVETLVGGPGVGVLAHTLVELAVGQAADLDFPSRVGATVEDGIEMARAKTGALIGGACQLGALTGSADVESSLAFRRFGCELGVAFQLVDDLLGIWGDPRATGKPLATDLTGRKKSLPVLAALTSGGSAAVCLAELYDRETPWGAEDLRRAADLITEAGGRAWAEAEASARWLAALGHLEGAGADADAYRDLVVLGSYLLGRVP